jgi:flagellar hook-associated protein 3 FlgL
MRIATSTVYANQTAAIDQLYAEQQLYGQQLSTGKDLNIPQDNPTQIAQDLAVKTDNVVQTQLTTNLTNSANQLTTVDGALGSLTSVIQSARQLAIEGAADTNTPSQLKEIAIQVGQLLQEAIGLANSQYAGTYVFGGTAQTGQPPVIANGQASVVNFTGNGVAQTQKLPNGQTITTSTTLQQAFNYNAPDGSPSVFQVLQNLYNTLNNDISADTSSTQVNVAGTAITVGTSLALLATTAATPLVPDNTGRVSISIASAADPNGAIVTFDVGPPDPNGPPYDTINTMLTKINAATALTCVSASWNSQTDRITFNGPGPFTIDDVNSPAQPVPPIAASTNTGNFVATFNLQNQADLVNNISQQLGDIDNVTARLLNSRAAIGSTIQEVNALNQTATSQANNDTTVQSNIEDTNIAKATTQFSLAQTALQAAYGTTSQLEGKNLFDYIT